MTKNYPSFSFLSWRTFWNRFSHYGIAFCIFLIGLLISFLIFRFYQIQNVNRTHAEFDRIADLRLFLMKEAFLETLEQIEYINNFYNASNQVTSKDFGDFVHEIFTHYHNYLALGWLDSNSPLNSAQNSSIGFNFINLDQNEGISHFFPLTYLEKSELHPSFYFDSSDYFTFLDLLKTSQNNLEVNVSENFAYFQKETKQGFFLFKSLFFDVLKSHNNHKSGLFGTIIGFSNFEDIVENIRSRVEPIGINIRIDDVSTDQPQLLYWDEARTLQDSVKLSAHEQELQENWTRNQTFHFGNRIWNLQAIPTLELIRLQQGRYQHWEIPLLGILISAILSSYFLILTNQRIFIEQKVRDRTNELAAINRILHQEIHERQRVEKELMSKQNNLQRRLEALKYLTKLTSSELRKGIHEVILRTAIVMQVERVSVWLYETLDQMQNLSCEGLYTLSTNSFSNHLKINSFHFPHYFNNLATHSHLILPSPHDDELNLELSSYFSAFQIHCKLDVPIIFEGNLLGILSCEETRGHREWTLEDRHFCQTMTDIVAIMIEQSARLKAENALKESEERLRFITQRSIDGIISINDKEEIISWNYGAQQMFGYNEMEILGKSLQMIILHDEMFLQNRVRTKPIELQGKHRDGHIFPAEISQTRWEDEEGFFDTIIIRDITERKEYEKRLIKAMHEAKAANASKSEFLATISHELRTPLNAIIGFNQCLAMEMDGPLNESQKESLKKIEKSSFHLLNLINDLLDWSKIEAKKMELEIASQNIVEIVTSCIEEMQSLAQQKKLNLSLLVDKPVIFAQIDRMRIRQVLLNLLSNAIKFTEKGMIKVVLTDHPNYIQIQIIDTGIGLLPEEREKIFQSFTQADSSITRKYGGTGLGLVISKNIIDLHGGTITVESQKGQGSTFTITLPKQV